MTASSPRYSRITGTGSCLPPRRVTNEEFAADLAQRGIETSDQWIVCLLYTSPSPRDD